MKNSMCIRRTCEISAFSIIWRELEYISSGIVLRVYLTYTIYIHPSSQEGVASHGHLPARRAASVPNDWMKRLFQYDR